jgi:hypothetical protein
VALALVALGCGEEVAVARLEIDGPVVDGFAVDDALPDVEPDDALVAARARAPARSVLVVRADAGDIVVRAGGACERVVRSDELARAAGGSIDVALDPLFAIEGERAEVGFGERFVLRVLPGCEMAERARLSWAADGDDVAELAVSEDGREVRGRMPLAAEIFGEGPYGAGVLAVSPRTRGTRALVLVATLAGGATLERRVEVHAAARATGMPSIPVSVRSYLGGAGLSIVDAPRDASPSLAEVAPGLFALVPDRAGRYVLAQSEGEPFSIFAGSHVATPLDCGRSDCHRGAAEHAGRSPMTTLFSRMIDATSYTPACAIACHAVGEPGTDDGGFVDVAEALGVALPSHGGAGEHARLPRELRRLGSVGCTSCHGPGAIPEPSAAERILSADVCAFCHDAPPRYGHVVAWRQSRMARSDVHAGVRDRAECASCHTTAGFLGRAVVPGAAGARTGIACAACHAPHAETSDAPLLRRPPLPALLTGVETTLDEAPSRVCVACHAPGEGSDVPAASAVALVAGRGAFARDGSVLAAPAPHASLERGCLACHGTARARGIEGGAGHAFGVDPDVCARCHEARAGREALEARAEALAARLAEAGSSRPSRAAARAAAPETALDRARWNVALVLLDAGAFAHAGRGATEVLDEAEAMLAR